MRIPFSNYMIISFNTLPIVTDLLPFWRSQENPIFMRVVTDCYRLLPITAQPAAKRRDRPAVNPLQRLRLIALAIILAWGWKRALIAMAAGALSVLALAPFNVFPVLFITFPVLVWLIDGAGGGRLGGIPGYQSRPRAGCG